MLYALLAQLKIEKTTTTIGHNKLINQQYNMTTSKREIQLQIIGNTDPSSVGTYHYDTGILLINGNIKIYPNYSFTKRVTSIIPTISNHFVINVVGTLQFNHMLGSPLVCWKSVKYNCN